MGHPSFEPSSHPLRQLLAQTPQRLHVLDLKACKKLKLTTCSERKGRFIFKTSKKIKKLNPCNLVRFQSGWNRISLLTACLQSPSHSMEPVFEQTDVRNLLLFFFQSQPQTGALPVLGDSTNLYCFKCPLFLQTSDSNQQAVHIGGHSWVFWCHGGLQVNNVLPFKCPSLKLRLAFLKWITITTSLFEFEIPSSGHVLSAL